MYRWQCSNNLGELAKQVVGSKTAAVLDNYTLLGKKPAAQSRAQGGAIGLLLRSQNGQHVNQFHTLGTQGNTETDRKVGFLSLD